MDRVKWDIPRCLADFFHECDQRPRTEKETEWQVNLQAEGERFLQKADSILRNAECSDPKMAKCFPEQYTDIFFEARSWVHVYERRLLYGERSRMKAGVHLYCAFCQRFLDEVLEPWRERFLRSVNLSEQLLFMEAELMHLDIGDYERLFYDVLREKTRKQMNEEGLSELHSLELQIKRLAATFGDSEAYKQVFEHGNASQQRELRWTVVGLDEITRMIGKAIEPYRRALAIAMGQHRRLGGNGASPFAGLSDDLMSQIAGNEGHRWHALGQP